MPIRRRSARDGGGWLVDLRVDGRRIRQTFPADLSRADAERLGAQLLLEASRPRRAGPGPTFGELAARLWLEHGQHLANRDYLHHLRRWARELGEHTPAGRITASRLAEIVGRWRGTCSDTTINRRLATLRVMWNRARDAWGEELHPVRWRALWLAEPVPFDRSIAVEIRQAFVDLLPPRSRYLAAFLAVTGERIGARSGGVLGLTARDFDWQRGVISIRTKGQAGGKLVSLAMSDAVLGVLQAMGPLPEVGRIWRVSYRQYRDDARRALDELGLPHARPAHDLRHSFAQDVEDAGLGDAIPDLLHHSTPNLRRRYSQARLDRQRQVVDEIFARRRK